MPNPNVFRPAPQPPRPLRPCRMPHVAVSGPPVRLPPEAAFPLRITVGLFHVAAPLT